MKDIYWSKMQVPEYSAADPRPRNHLKIGGSFNFNNHIISGHSSLKL